VLRSIDVTSEFVARCEFYDDQRALYRVSQGKQTMRFVVPLRSDGSLVKALGLEWPLHASIGWCP
jgi:hypothetical protein